MDVWVSSGLMNVRLIVGALDPGPSPCHRIAIWQLLVFFVIKFIVVQMGGRWSMGCSDDDGEDA